MPSSSKSKWSRALSKRRPRQNIIAMILNKAKGSGSSTVGNSTSSSSRSTKGWGTERSSSRSKRPSRSRAILQSAADLTGKLSKRSSARKRPGRDGKGGSFVKGQRAFYRSSKGICKVTVVGVHHDAKLEPYYTIKLKDGKEKQVDGKHLTPVQDVAKSVTKDKKHDEKTDDSKKSIRKSVSKTSVVSKEVSVTDQTSDSSSEDDSEDANASEQDGSFATGQSAYYRSPEGQVSKVKVIKVYSSTSEYKYGVDLPDGTSKDVHAGQLKALMDLTSDELAAFMKKKNEKSYSKENLALPSIEDLDPGYEAEKSDSSQETAGQSSDSNQQQQPVKETLALPSSVEMVEAKTENGGTKTVPKYAAKTELYYKNAQGIQKATILEAHLDDLLEPYYSIRLEDGKEKQTDNAHLMLTLPEEADSDGKEQEQQEGKTDESEEIEEAEIPAADVVVTENTHDISAKQETAPQEELSLVPLSIKTETPSNSTDLDVAPQVKKQVDPDAYALALVHNFSQDEVVLYSSSQGEHFRATVVKLLKDKKHRPYYVVRLPNGKEKQVYEHRLKPLRIGRADSSIDASQRSGRSRSTTRSRSHSEAQRTIKRILNRSDSSDSRGTSQTRTRRPSLSSEDKRNSMKRSKSLSRARSVSRGPRSQSRAASRSRGQAAGEDAMLRMKSLRRSMR